MSKSVNKEKRRISKSYNSQATSYDLTRGFYEWGYGGLREREELSNIMRWNGNVLDLACGTGRLLGFLQALSYETVGIDISKNMLMIARKKEKKIHFVLGDVENLPFRERIFLYSLCSRAFKLFPNPIKFLKECWRCLRINGILSLSFESKDPLWVKIAIRMNILNAREFKYSIDNVSRLLNYCNYEILFSRCLFYWGRFISEKCPKKILNILHKIDLRLDKGRNSIIISRKKNV